MTTALDYRKQVSSNKPAKAFLKARKVYGKRMEDAPGKSRNKHEVKTNFNELIRLQIKQSEKHQRAVKLRTGMVLAVVLGLLYLSLFGISLPG